MAVEYFTDTVEDVPYEEPRYEEIYYPGGIGGPFTCKSPLNSFVEKRTGRLFVDGEYVSHWVQYL